MRRHRLPVAHFDALAAGLGGPATIRLLRGAELSKLLLRLRALLDVTGPPRPDGIELLAEAQRRAPQTVADLLLYPHVAAWVSACLRRLHATEGATGGDDLAHLGAVAAAAAIRAGMSLDVAVRVRGGTVVLPTLGCAEVGPPGFDGVAAVRSTARGVEVASDHRTVVLPADPHADGPGWWGLRRLDAIAGGRALGVYLDDIDPFRDNHGLGPAPRLAEESLRDWRRTTDAAWDILADHHPHRAEAIAVGLTALVPLAAHRGRRELSATSADAPGAVAITPPGDPLLLAESLVHEFQHVKLCALLDLLPLHAPDDGERFYAPWRDDPRPLGGLLHGAYAYLGVTDFWGRQQRVMTGDDRTFAQYAFVLWRDQTRHAIGRIEGSGRLTANGERFVAGMRASLEAWTDTTVAAEAGAHAEDTAADHALTWRVRHLRPDPADVDQIALAWPGGTPAPPLRRPELTASDREPGTRNTRTGLRHLRLRHPDEFARVRATRGDADVALVAGHGAEAADRYRARLADDPGSAEDWAGLAIAARRGGAAIPALTAFPEVVAAVHHRIGELRGSRPDPLDLARWLTPAVR
ncbi:HEXXH motif domain-containing protein [Thermomonospora umbrina]|uniref:HEXXH motif-containing protein n=1 Tax=Thermomonospora umbrina TaxID=111806 RepID=A0A3D9SHV9_9ACTN|nr:HEXXH motif domain-containing protein [Thermomonospora umbrina]REE95486.1 HEXXH motif-containing protein [Thermomonospora umbrina]